VIDEKGESVYDANPALLPEMAANGFHDFCVSARRAFSSVADELPQQCLDLLALSFWHNC
jgi:hypothetical protein